jgi:predicted metal-dependent hydrolase
MNRFFSDFSTFLLYKQTSHSNYGFRKPFFTNDKKKDKVKKNVCHQSLEIDWKKEKKMEKEALKIGN